MNDLLDYIAKFESRGDPDVVWSGIARGDRPENRVGKTLTSMTIREVLAWQDSIDSRYMSEAAGKWQFLEDTLRGLYREAGVPLSARFDEPTQRKLATQLLRRRGLDDYLAGRMSSVAFANALAKEWASLPVVTDMRGASRDVKRGQSYYAGDGLNKAHADPDRVLYLIAHLTAKPAPDPRESPTESGTVKAVGGTAVAGGTGAVAAIANLDGTAQLIVIGAAVVAGLALAWLLRRRLREWAEGRR